METTAEAEAAGAPDPGSLFLQKARNNQPGVKETSNGNTFTEGLDEGRNDL